ncbi:MAG: SUMF1/EgtB/PvdO family nonheme iron enzyme [Acidobacteria bacterium]|nr:SUMF1/EgtB/PvdO family nonheme iron enzyme [Acidobacteriota bacterium]
MRFRNFLLAVALIASATGQDTQYPAQSMMIPGPASAADFASWLSDLKHWRSESRIRLGYSGSQYDRPELKWTQQSFVQPQMMIHDRFFFDPDAGKYTVSRYLDDLGKRYGAIDSVLIWHSYPNMGIDNRNQYDLIRDMPRGIPGVRQMVSDFHTHDVRVLFPVMVWDQGTRDEGIPDWNASTQLMAAVGADGLNGDTLYDFPLVFRTASDQTGHSLALEPQVPSAKPSEALAWDNLSWNDWIILNEHGGWQYPFIPQVAADKWLEPRHMVNVCDRWAHDKTDDLQHAFFNGVGYESWENIWGIWNQIDDRDAEALRRIAMIERTFATLLTSADWEPHTPAAQYGVFASKFPGGKKSLWTVVNRNTFDVNGPQIKVPYQPGEQYYDLWHAVQLTPEVKGNLVWLSFDVEQHGYGAVLATTGLTAEEQQFLSEMQNISKRPLSSYSAEWHFLPQHLVDIPLTKRAATAPAGMVKIPAGDFDFTVSGVEIEGGNEIGVDVQMPWENSPRRQHSHWMHLKSFYIDRYPVTNADYKKFLDTTHYHPKDNHNFLREWKNGTYPHGWGGKPVTWVSLEDARAYAAWAGKRLPHEWEWQYAAQGSDGRVYPWGDTWDPSAIPVSDTGRTLSPPTDVASHSRGASPFGVIDLVGNVWQWTDEYQDEHTRAAIVRGGSHYSPAGSRWYFPQNRRLDEHGKYLLMAPSLDRAATLGFRCLVDSE